MDRIQVPSNPKEIGIPYDSWRPFQKETVEKIVNSEKRVIVLSGPTGCHALGQKILMYDGSLQRVEDIKVDDLLMGANSAPHKVLSLIRGTGLMYKISPIKGEPFVVNEDHILTLVYTNEGHHDSVLNPRKDKIYDISVKDFIKQTKNRRSLQKLFRTGVTFPPLKGENLLTVDPYILGVILGDGSTCNGSISVSSIDPEIIKSLNDYAISLGLKVRKGGKFGYYLTTGRQGEKKENHSNPLLSKLRNLGVIERSGTKFVPLQYKLGDRNTRLQILAGLMDTDGSLFRNVFDFTSKSIQLANDVAFIARSLGLLAIIRQCVSDRHLSNGKTYLGNNYFRVIISGNTDIIPTRVKRKQATIRKQKKNPLRTGFSIKPYGIDKYYGFSIDGDGRYLLEDFIVTHNSGKSAISCSIPSLLSLRGVIVTKTTQLQQQYTDVYKIPLLKGRGNYACQLQAGLSADDCVKVLGVPCDFYPLGCDYYSTKTEARNSPLYVTNYKYFILSGLSEDDKYTVPVLVADEAHEIEHEISDIAGVVLTKRMLMAVGLDMPQHLGNNAENWVEWARSVSRIIEIKRDKLIKEITEIPGDNIQDTFQGRIVLSKLKETKRILGIANKLVKIKESKVPWVVYKTSENYASLRPLWIAEYTHDLLFRKVTQKSLLMSATLFNPERLQKHFGLGDIEYIEVESTFPVENRPFLYYPIKKMNNRSDKDDSIPQMARAIEQVLNRFPTQKGLVHTGNFTLAERLIAELSKTQHKSRLITHKGMDRNESIKNFMDSTRPLVMFSPSMESGVDLHDDLAGFQIIAKIPFDDLGDPLIMARKNADPDWYMWSVATKIVQAYGRVVRGPTERKPTYCFDTMFSYVYSKTKDYLPDWFKSAVVWK